MPLFTGQLTLKSCISEAKVINPLRLPGIESFLGQRTFGARTAGVLHKPGPGSHLEAEERQGSSSLSSSSDFLLPKLCHRGRVT